MILLLADSIEVYLRTWLVIIYESCYSKEIECWFFCPFLKFLGALGLATCACLWAISSQSRSDPLCSIARVVLHCSMKRIGLEIEGTYIGDTTQSLLLSLVNENWPEHVFDRMGEIWRRREIQFISLLYHLSPLIIRLLFSPERATIFPKRNIAIYFFQLNSTVWFFTVLLGYNFEREL